MIRNYIDKEHSEVIDGSLKYLSEKYGEHFEVINFIGQSLNFPGDRIGVRAVGGDSFTVFAYKKDGEITYRDTYFSLIIKDEYEEFMHKIIEKHFNRFEMNIDISNQGCNPSGLNKGVRVDDIHKKEDGCYIFYSKVEISLDSRIRSEKLDRKLLSALKEIASHKLICWVICRSLSASVTYYIGEDFEPVKITPAAEETYAVSRTIPPTLSNQQLERLCIIVYLNNITDNLYLGNLGDIMRFMKLPGITDNIVGDELPCEMTRSEWETVINDVINDPMLSRLQITKYTDISETDDEELSGHRALCFSDKRNNAYTVFRGTAGDAEWYDNALGMIESDTPFQKAAAEFVRSVKDDKELEVNYLVVAGHSKGGNKAQYSAVVLPEGYVDKCFTLDGQGFSKSFFEKYAGEIKKTQNLIISAAERRDFVNCFGYYLCKPTFYTGRRGEHSEINPYGEPLPFFHCPDALRTADDKIGDIAEYAYIPKTLNEMSTYFFSNPAYEDIWEQTAVSVVSLMMRKKRATALEIAEAAVNIILVFLELVSRNKEFYDDIINLIETESDVLVATALMLSKKSSGNKGFADMIIELLAAAMRKKPVYIVYLLKTALKFTLQVKEAAKNESVNKTVYILICDFIAETLKIIIEKSNMLILKPIHIHWEKLTESLKGSDGMTDAEESTLSAIVNDITGKLN